MVGAILSQRNHDYVVPEPAAPITGTAAPVRPMKSLVAGSPHKKGAIRRPFCRRADRDLATLSDRPTDDPGTDEDIRRACAAPPVRLLAALRKGVASQGGSARGGGTAC